jgi:hypothetical protein
MAMSTRADAPSVVTGPGLPRAPFALSADLHVALAPARTFARLAAEDSRGSWRRAVAKVAFNLAVLAWR